jgi:uncharacterized protein (TIGR00299 family) protein
LSRIEAGSAGDPLTGRIGYLDCFSGMAGDMLLGAIIDAGLDPETLRAGLASLGISGYSLTVKAVTRAGVGGTRVEVLTAGPQPARRLNDILGLLDASDLPSAVRHKAHLAFSALAQAEARVHRCAVEDVHFHEVGALDAIVDVVGSALGLAALGVERLYCSPLPIARGRVRCAHGELPLPAPATVELLRGFPLQPGQGETELVTPTGAAMLAAWATPTAAWPTMVLEAVGYGAGGQELPTPNLVRLVVGRVGLGTLSASAGSSWILDGAILTEANLDDVTPQEVAYMVDTLLEGGALDAWATPIVMKKGRPGVKLTALTLGCQSTAAAATFFREGITPGLRQFPVHRFRVPVEEVRVTVGAGEVRVKRMRGQDGFLRIWPEYEDCRAIARESGTPLAKVLAAARQAASEPGTQERGENEGGQEVDRP